MNYNEIKIGDLNPTKQKLQVIADEIHAGVMDGNVNPLNIAITMNAMEQLIKMVKERIQSEVLHELGKYPKSKAELNGVTVSTMDTVKYDFSHVQGWQELEDQITILKEKQKAIEDHEKTYFKGDLPIKSATSTFKIQLPK
jgi:archaellin